MATHGRIRRRPVHGVLLLDKPLGWSSNQALQKAKWLLRAEKGGHTGTLDPLATGVLPLAFGAAAKFSGFQLAADKTYDATLQLGVRTTTGDREGAVIEQRPVPALEAALLAQVVERFRGRIEQVPPMHSALKKGGKALYEYARAGVEVERAPRVAEIHALALEPSGEARLDLRVRCGKGTYIRTLAEDIGAALGCGAHLAALRRVATGPFTIAQCVTLEAFERLDEGERMACLLGPEGLLEGAGRIDLDAREAGFFLTGQRRRGNWPDADLVAVHGRDPDAFLGTARIVAGELIAQRLLSPIEIRQILDACVPAPAAA